MYGDECKLDLLHDHFAICTDIESLCCTFETNVMLNINYNSKNGILLHTY